MPGKSFGTGKWDGAGFTRETPQDAGKGVTGSVKSEKVGRDPALLQKKKNGL